MKRLVELNNEAISEMGIQWTRERASGILFKVSYIETLPGAKWKIDKHIE